MKTTAPDQGTKPQAVIHVDLDGASHIFRSHGWHYNLDSDPLFASGLNNFLDFLDRNDIKATFFTIASDLDDSRFRIVGKNAPKIGPFLGSVSMISATCQIPDPQNT